MIDDKLSKVYGLAFNCPFKFGCNGCPFENIRKKNIRERIEYIEKLDQSESDALYNSHYKNYMKNFG